MKKLLLLLFILFIGYNYVNAQTGFVQRKLGQFVLDSKPYYYIGANYWYGSVLGLQQDKSRGIDRLSKELDFLIANGINNIRVIAAIEGSGLVNGVPRVQPPLQTDKGKFDASVLKGLDILLSEMNKRNMKGVLMLSNNWEWSGGFLQYLRWNGMIEDSVFRRKMTWDELSDQIGKFYNCDECKKDYLNQINYILSHTNTVTGKKYINDPAIMAWELANEPRPMRPASIDAYKKWINNVATFIKSKDSNHLITTGAEGDMGTLNSDVFEQTHAYDNIDYLTIHIWPKNWSWFKEPSTMESDFPNVQAKTEEYINKHVAVAQKLQKPLVIEEFGYPRDHHSYSINSTTNMRDQYYDFIFNKWKESKSTNGVIAGASFWAFNGNSRPIPNQVFWKEGDDYMGDPPMEEQGLNGVFDSDQTTWSLIRSFTKTPIGKMKIKTEGSKTKIKQKN